MSWYPGPAWLNVASELPNGYLRALQVADAVVVDLAAHPVGSERRSARRVVRKLGMHDLLDRERTVFRIDPRKSSEYENDILVLRDIEATTVLLTCAEGRDDLDDLAGFNVIAGVESMRAVQRIDAIAGARNCLGIVWNGCSVYSSMCADSSPHAASGRFREILGNAEARVARSARAYDRLALYQILAPATRLREEYLTAARSGFDGLIETDRRRIPTIRECFSPSAEELASARSVLMAAMLSDTSGVFADGVSDLHAAERIIIRSVMHANVQP